MIGMKTEAIRHSGYLYFQSRQGPEVPDWMNSPPSPQSPLEIDLGRSIKEGARWGISHYMHLDGLPPSPPTTVLGFAGDIAGHLIVIGFAVTLVILVAAILLVMAGLIYGPRRSLAIYRGVKARLKARLRRFVEALSAVIWFVVGLTLVVYTSAFLGVLDQIAHLHRWYSQYWENPAVFKLLCLFGQFYGIALLCEAFSTLSSMTTNMWHHIFPSRT